MCVLNLRLKPSALETSCGAMDLIKQTIWRHDPLAIDTSIQISILLKVVVTAAALCSIQIVLFCVLRPWFPSVFQPRGGQTSSRWGIWLQPMVEMNDHVILSSMGLDAYFFIRLLQILLGYFTVVGCLNAVVLVPVTYSAKTQEPFLVKLNISNVPDIQTVRLYFHCAMAIILVILFLLMSSYELWKYQQIKYSYLQANLSSASRTVLFSNVPKSWLNHGKLQTLFSNFGEVEVITFVHDASMVRYWANQLEKAVADVEYALVCYTRNWLRKHYLSASILRKLWRNSEAQIQPRGRVHCYDSRCELWMPKPIVLGPWLVSGFNKPILMEIPGILSMIWRPLVEALPWSIDRLNYAIHNHQNARADVLRNSTLRQAKVFVRFSSIRSANIAHQCYLPPLTAEAIEIRPFQIVWENISYSCWRSQCQRYLSNVVLLLIILTYIFPVSLIGLVFSLPFLTLVLPMTRWITRNIPSSFTDVVTGFLPAMFLSYLSMFVHCGFRKLSTMKGWVIYAQVEEDLQCWYFWFLWIHQFLVVSVLALVFSFAKQIVSDPYSIPKVLAINLPRALTFYLHFFISEAWGLLGGSFLSLHAIVVHLLQVVWCRRTPRQWNKCINKLPQPEWGTKFSSFTVLGCISLTYLVISPVVALIFVLLLWCALVSYRYKLKYVYDRKNRGETYGKLYPTAIFQLYMGIYCLEISLMGIYFFHPSTELMLGFWLMMVCLLLTVFFHMTQIAAVRRSLNTMSPVIDVEKPISADEVEVFRDPCFEPLGMALWLPKDPLGIAQYQLGKVEQKTKMPGGTTRGAKLDLRYFWMPCEVICSNLK